MSVERDAERAVISASLVRSHEKVYDLFQQVDAELVKQEELLVADGQPDYEVDDIVLLRKMIRNLYFGVNSPHNHYRHWDVANTARHYTLKEGQHD